MEEILKSYGVGRRPIKDPFFDDSYQVCKVFQRTGVTVEDDEELCHEVIRKFPCYVPECKATFDTLLDYEIHYNGSHRYVCMDCKQSRPNERLLDIHIQETHDSFFKVLSEKQPMYQCFLSICDTKFNNPKERREHCINVHKFPKHYRFDTAHHEKEEAEKMEVEVESDKKQTKAKSTKIVLNKTQKIRTFIPLAKTPVTNTDVTESNPVMKPSPSSSLMFVPRQVSYAKALTKNESKEQNVLEKGNMMDLAESLPE